MAAISKTAAGGKTHVFGAGLDIENAHAQNFSWDNSWGTEEKVHDKDGREVEHRMDDRQVEASGELVVNEDYDDDLLMGANIDIPNAAFGSKTVGSKAFYIIGVGGR